MNKDEARRYATMLIVQWARDNLEDERGHPLHALRKDKPGTPFKIDDKLRVRRAVEAVLAGLEARVPHPPACTK